MATTEFDISDLLQLPLTELLPNLIDDGPFTVVVDFQGVKHVVVLAKGTQADEVLRRICGEENVHVPSEAPPRN